MGRGRLGGKMKRGMGGKRGGGRRGGRKGGGMGGMGMGGDMEAEMAMMMY